MFAFEGFYTRDLHIVVKCPFSKDVHEVRLVSENFSFVFNLSCSELCKCTEFSLLYIGRH